MFSAIDYRNENITRHKTVIIPTMGSLIMSNNIFSKSAEVTCDWQPTEIAAKKPISVLRKQKLPA